MKESRKIYLEFICHDCGQTVIVEREDDLFGIVESQIVAESQKLHCESCIKGSSNTRNAGL